MIKKINLFSYLLFLLAHSVLLADSLDPMELSSYSESQIKIFDEKEIINPNASQAELADSWEKLRLVLGINAYGLEPLFNVQKRCNEYSITYSVLSECGDELIATYYYSTHDIECRKIQKNTIYSSSVDPLYFYHLRWVFECASPLFKQLNFPYYKSLIQSLKQRDESLIIDLREDVEEVTLQMKKTTSDETALATNFLLNVGVWPNELVQLRILNELEIRFVYNLSDDCYLAIMQNGDIILTYQVYFSNVYEKKIVKSYRIINKRGLTILFPLVDPLSFYRIKNWQF